MTAIDEATMKTQRIEMEIKEKLKLNKHIANAGCRMSLDEIHCKILSLLITRNIRRKKKLFMMSENDEMRSGKRKRNKKKINEIVV